MTFVGEFKEEWREMLCGESGRRKYIEGGNGVLKEAEKVEWAKEK